MKYLVISHDVGGAEIVSSWVRKNPQNQYKFVLDGPAVSIFEKKLIEIKREFSKKLEELVICSDFVLTGTSQSSTLEKRAIMIAKESGTPVATFLDYWYGYEERFVYQGKTVLPDEIWVGDKYALDLARTIFPQAKIVFHDNPYLQEILEEKQKINLNANKKGLRILYLCQSYSEACKDINGIVDHVTDISGLEYYLQSLLNHLEGEVEVRLRLHPTESKNKYRDIIQSFTNSLKITVSKNNSLVEDCVWADWAVGMHTMALVVALTVGCKTFHCIPPGGKPCALPHKEIGDFKTYIQDFAG